jgi:hypothetical protein
MEVKSARIKYQSESIYLDNYRQIQTATPSPTLKGLCHELEIKKIVKLFDCTRPFLLEEKDSLHCKVCWHN